MSWLRSTTLFRGSLVAVGDVRCYAPRSAFGSPEQAPTTEVILPRAGAFVVDHDRRQVVADSGSALVLRAGVSYRVSHPVPGGDSCSVFVLQSHELADELLRGTRDSGLVPLQVLLASHIFTAALRQGVDELEGDEGALRVLSLVTLALAGEPQQLSPISETTSRRVGDIKALLTSAPGTRWTLEKLAKTVPCSPFHLARQFRAVTGESVVGYLSRLRVGLALERLAAGERDLARIAFDLGFSSHSHFSARFRALVGTPPSRLREQLTRSTLAQLRTNLTAQAPEGR